MALDYLSRREYAEKIRNYCKEHSEETFTLKDMRTYLENDLHSSTLVAMLPKCCRRVGTGKYYICREMDIYYYEKDKNFLRFYNLEKEMLPLYYDFNTKIFNLNITNICIHDHVDCSFMHSLNMGLIPEWIFNYSDLFDSNTLFRLDCKVEEYPEVCPKGYISWLKDNQKRLNLKTIAEYDLFLTFGSQKAMELYTNIDDAMDISRFIREKCVGIDYTKEDFKQYINKNAESISFAYEHEYLENFYQNDMSWGAGRGNAMRKAHELIGKYIILASVINEKPIWKNVLKNYSIIKTMYMLHQNEITSKNIALYNNQKCAYENENFKVIVPTTFEEFKKEADYQQNCVCALYSKRVANDETNVVFIRRKSDLDTPYITCEVNNFGGIVQYLTRFNRTVMDKDALEFQNEYRKYLRTIF